MYEQQDLQPRSKSGAGDEEKRTEKLFSIHFTSEKPLDLYLVHPDKVFGCGVGMSSILTKTPTLKLRSASSPFCVSRRFFFVFCYPTVGCVFYFHAWDSPSGQTQLLPDDRWCGVQCWGFPHPSRRCEFPGQTPAAVLVGNRVSSLHRSPRDPASPGSRTVDPEPLASEHPEDCVPAESPARSEERRVG